MAPVKGVCIVTLEVGKGCVKHFPARNDDDVQAGRNLMTPEDLPRDPFGAIPLHRNPELPPDRDAQPRHRCAVRDDEQRHETPGYSNARLVGPLEIRSPANPLGRRQSERGQHGYCSSETVKRLRPLARRLLRTMRPFFVAIRTLKPCVFLRRLVFG
jgi:hypothetical protein